jgi:glutamate synthase (NADPH/NADH) small chain
VAHDPQGFLRHARADRPKRPIAERVRDWQPIYLTAPGGHVQQQAARCMDCGVAFCHAGCPLGNLIPDWNEMVAGDLWSPASERLHATNNFPEFTGWICPAPCEAACVPGDQHRPGDDQAGRDLHCRTRLRRRAGAAAAPTVRTGRRVAVVGSGPAGLAAAQQLTRAGHG